MSLALTSRSISRPSPTPGSWRRSAATRCAAHCSSSAHGRRSCAARSSQPGSAGAAKPEDGEDEEFVGLLPEEDQEVPGTYFDALNRNTKLGKAVAAAVDELEHLNDMEMESLAQAEEMLKKLGLKGSLFGAAGAPPPPKSKGKKGGGCGAAADDDDDDGGDE